MSIFATLAEKIIVEQETIIGPVAVEQATKVTGLRVDWQKHEISIEGDESEVVQKLVEQYRHFFGQASVEVCKDAVKEILAQVPKNQIPSLLR